MLLIGLLSPQLSLDRRVTRSLNTCQQGVISSNAALASLSIGDNPSTWINCRWLQLLSSIRQLIELGRQFTGSIWLKVH